MRWLALLLLVGCSLPTAPVVPEIEAWFENVPLERYSRDPEVFFAFQAHAIQTPADTTYWRLDYLTPFGWHQVEVSQSDPGLRAGHRWYIPRDQPLRLRFTAWGCDVDEVVAEFDYQKGLP